MRKIVHLLYFCYIVLFATSCNSLHFYSTIDTSSKETFKTHTGDFLFQNDTLSITYSFNGYDTPIQLSIYNKLNKPLVIDWQKSFIIIDDIANSYFKEDATFKGYSKNYSVSESENRRRYSRSYSESYSDIEGNINIPHKESYIPPQSKIEHEGFYLQSIDFTHIDDKSYSEATLNDKNNKPIKVKKLEFSENNSPLSFRSYLTLYTEEAKDTPTAYEQRFFISNLYKSNSLSPQNLSSRMRDRGDVFYTETGPNTSTWTYIAGGAGIAAVVYVLVYGLTMDTKIEKPNF